MTRLTHLLLLLATLTGLGLLHVGCAERNFRENGTDNGETDDGSDDGWDNRISCVHGDSNNGEEEQYHFVLLEDLSDDVNGTDAPGADIDGIAIERDGQDIAYADNVEDANIGGADNGYTDTYELLGAPDSGCMKQNFTALGGAPNDGWVIVSFENDETIQSGDYIVVYELGPTACPGQPTWKDDAVGVSISVSVQAHGSADWVTLGQITAGNNTVSVDCGL